MQIKFKSKNTAETIAWTAVKGWIVLVLVWLTLPPLTTTMSGPMDTGLKTVLAGRIRAGRVTPVTLDFSARTVSVEVKAGDTVAAGQLLAVLESPELEARLERFQRRMELTSLRMKTQPKTARLLWQEQHRSAQQQSQEARARLSAVSTESAESAVARAEREYASISRMLQEHLATAQDVEVARKQLENEKANLNNVRNTRTRLTHEVRSADSQLRMVVIQKGVADPAMDPAARLDYEDAATAVEALERQKKALRVVAPRAGIVLTVAVQPGAEAGGWAPLFQITDLNSLQVEVPVTSRLARMIHPGTPVNIVIPGDPPEAVAANVGEMQVVPDQTQQSHVVRIPLPNAGGRIILIGMDCSVEFPHGGPA